MVNESVYPKNLSMELTTGRTMVLRMAHLPVNALSLAFRVELLEALGRAERDGAVHAVVLTGREGLGFSAGVDLREASAIDSPALAADTARMEIEFCEGVCRFSKPLIAAIDRYAFGGGFELALAAGWRFACSRARVGFPEASLGAFPAGGAVALLTGLIGNARARQLMMTGEMLSAEKALEIGLVEAVVREEALLTEAIAFADRFSGMAIRSSQSDQGADAD